MTARGCGPSRIFLLWCAKNSCTIDRALRPRSFPVIEPRSTTSTSKRCGTPLPRFQRASRQFSRLLISTNVALSENSPSPKNMEVSRPPLRPLLASFLSISMRTARPPGPTMLQIAAETSPQFAPISRTESSGMTNLEMALVTSMADTQATHGVLAGLVLAPEKASNGGHRKHNIARNKNIGTSGMWCLIFRPFCLNSSD
mmetsp:Transcript_31814/g.49245  ORF Transcript_31814/g.49245 Transcript_31814/m.49245 type:complete len:200 (+) Transcript_31814:637-1236(+)